MPENIRTIDCHYLRPRFAAAYLLRQADRAAFVDNNTRRSVPALLAALGDEGLRPESVDWVIVTHVHLDHASGSAELMKACPNATLLCHPRAAPHLIDPTKLVESARKVYGEENFRKLYGEIEPVAPERVRTVADGELLSWGSRPLRFLHTRGHANHHIVIEDVLTRSIFTGDAFGLAYPDLQRDGLFVLPSTSPTDFDPAEALASVDRILATGVTTAYPTHFGPVDRLPDAAAQLKEHLQASAAILRDARDSAVGANELDSFCERRLREYLENYAKSRGLAWSAGERELLELDLKLNAQGIAHTARRQREKAAVR